MTRNPLDAFERFPDKAGHLIPITGEWCRACKFPLHPALTTDTHPNCEKGEGR